MYFDQPDDGFDRPVERELGLVMTMAAAFTLLFLFFQSPIIGAAEAAALSVLPR